MGKEKVQQDFSSHQCGNIFNIYSTYITYLTYIQMACLDEHVIDITLLALFFQLYTTIVIKDCITNNKKYLLFENKSPSHRSKD